MTDHGVYLYAVTRDLRGEQLAGLDGLRDGPVRLVDGAGLQAVTSEVDLAEFGTEALRRNLEDLGWLEEVARTHDRVVRFVADLSSTAPLRLATVCFDDAGVRRRLEDQADVLGDALDRITGRREWSLKIYAPEGPTPTVAEPRSESGTAYLQRRRSEHEQRTEASDRASASAGEIHARLGATVVASRLLNPQDQRLTGETRQMVLNCAYLVDEDRATEFEELVATLASDYEGAVDLALEGPWPAYSFATTEQPA